MGRAPKGNYSSNHPFSGAFAVSFREAKPLIWWAHHLQIGWGHRRILGCKITWQLGKTTFFEPKIPEMKKQIMGIWEHPRNALRKGLLNHHDTLIRPYFISILALYFLEGGGARVHSCHKGVGIGGSLLFPLLRTSPGGKKTSEFGTCRGQGLSSLPPFLRVDASRLVDVFFCCFPPDGKIVVSCSRVMCFLFEVIVFFGGIKVAAANLRLAMKKWLSRGTKTVQDNPNMVLYENLACLKSKYIVT